MCHPGVNRTLSRHRSRRQVPKNSMPGAPAVEVRRRSLTASSMDSSSSFMPTSYIVTEATDKSTRGDKVRTAMISLSSVSNGSRNYEALCRKSALYLAWRKRVCLQIVHHHRRRYMGIPLCFLQQSASNVYTTVSGHCSSVHARAISVPYLHYSSRVTLFRALAFLRPYIWGSLKQILD